VLQAVGGHFEGDADDAPEAAEGVVTQDESWKNGAVWRKRFAPPDLRMTDSIYNPTETAAYLMWRPVSCRGQRRCRYAQAGRLSSRTGYSYTIGK